MDMASHTVGIPCNNPAIYELVQESGNSNALAIE